MKTTKPTITTPDQSAPKTYQAGASYWILKIWGGRSAATAAAYGVSVCENPWPHDGLSTKGEDTPQELMKDLRARGWKISRFTNSRFQCIARVDVTASGFNLVCFPNYAAAVAAHKAQRDGKGLPACPFCRLADMLEIIGWSTERNDGSEYIGPAVRCNRCDAIAPKAAWLTLGKLVA